jgi:hypothetical protein
MKLVIEQLPSWNNIFKEANWVITRITDHEHHGLVRVQAHNKKSGQFINDFIGTSTANQYSKTFYSCKYVELDCYNG